jgi:hypothetical protein
MWDLWGERATEQFNLGSWKAVTYRRKVWNFSWGNIFVEWGRKKRSHANIFISFSLVMVTNAVTGARNVKPGTGTHHKHMYTVYEVLSNKTVYNCTNCIHIYNVTCFSLFGHPQAAHINYCVPATLANVYICRLCLCMTILITLSMLTTLVLLHHVNVKIPLKLKY